MPETPDTPPTGNAPLRRGAATEIEEIHQYIYAGGKLLRETITEGSTTKTLDFSYDNVGMPYSLIYSNGTTTATYYYITNLQGDVMYLVNADGVQVAAYDYDPYGKIITATGELAEINPMRYRGYYYDTETGFYYLQSRYYDPEICRFINVDSYASTGQSYLGYNTFVYCNNNPILYSDGKGRDAELKIVGFEKTIPISDVDVTISFSVSAILENEDESISVNFDPKSCSLTISAGCVSQTYDISITGKTSHSIEISFYNREFNETTKVNAAISLSDKGVGIATSAALACLHGNNYIVLFSVSVNPIRLVLKEAGKINTYISGGGACGTGYSPVSPSIQCANAYFGRVGPALGPFGRDVVSFY